MSRRDFSKLDENAALEAYRAAACADADAHFDERALDAQRQKIMARLAHLGHSARVIRFPKAAPADQQMPGVNRRWISVAAAAGLIIGLLGGQLVHLIPRQVTSRQTTTSGAPSAPSSLPSFVPAAFSADDGLLGEIELVMQSRTATELRALDELTLADQR